VIHTGDFKVDHDPVVGHPTDFSRLAQLCKDGIFLLMSDSTYAEDEGYSGSDRVVADGLFELIGRTAGRIIISSFASQIARLQIVADAAFAHGRKMAVVGRSMQNNTRLARELGHLDIPGDTLISLAEADSLPDEQVIIMTTGSQGEPTSGLVRMSRNDHREVRIRDGDTVIISASPIPGNEVGIYDTIDGLVRLGARVVTNRHANTHVSGHARREELRLMMNLVNPKYFVPVHGEYRMLRSHADLAIDQGINEDNVFLLTDGEVLEVTADGGGIVERVPAGHVFIHGLGIWDESGNVIVERRSLARDGFVAVAVGRDRRTREVRGSAKIISAGFVHAEEEAKLLTDAESELQSVLDRASTENLEWPQVEDLVRRTLEKFFSRRTRRRPLIATVALDV
jgi:ribonuclease J